jgi:rare lipoprotein A
MKKYGRLDLVETLVIPLGILFLWSCLWGCSAPPPQVSPGHPKPYKVHGNWYQPLPSATDFREVGLASWYGKKFHGRRTSNGEIYNMYAMTAAHKTLPLNTWVRVTRRDTGKSIVVRVNDRGPFVTGRIIDLSYTGAKKLGMVGPGTARVIVTALGRAILRSRWVLSR